jgi:LacI family transcriptional regulator
MDELPPLVSQRQIADKLNLSQATVSMALAGNPRIAEKTRQRILAAAETIGYRPDPALRSLAKYRKRMRAPVFQSTLAWVHGWPSALAWKGSAVFSIIFDSAQQRAAELGYKLENFWLEPQKMPPARAAEILLSRSVRGLILVPHSGFENLLGAEWQQFSAVRLLSHFQAGPRTHVLAADHHAAVFSATAELRQRGYRKLAFLSSHKLENQVFHAFFSAYCGQMKLAAERGEVWTDPLWFEEVDREVFQKWLATEKPDAILLTYSVEHYRNVVLWIQEMGVKIPEDLGIAMLCLPDYRAEGEKALPIDFSGVEEDFAQMGVGAVNLLVQNLENFEYATPVNTTRKLIMGRWHEGKTLRPRIPAQSP